MKYVRGELVAAVASRALAVADIAESPRIRQLMEAVERSGEVGAVLAALRPDDPADFSRLPSFALVRHEGDQQVRVLVRGDLTVRATLASGEIKVLEAGLAATWFEALLEAPELLEILGAEAAPGADFWPLGVGVVWASQIEWTPGDLVVVPASAVPAPVEASVVEAPAVKKDADRQPPSPPSTEAPPRPAVPILAPPPLTPPPRDVTRPTPMAEPPLPATGSSVPVPALEQSLSYRFLMGQSAEPADLPAGGVPAENVGAEANPAVTQAPPVDDETDRSDLEPEAAPPAPDPSAAPQPAASPVGPRAAGMLPAVPANWLPRRDRRPPSPSPTAPVVAAPGSLQRSAESPDVATLHQPPDDSGHPSDAPFSGDHHREARPRSWDAGLTVSRAMLSAELPGLLPPGEGAEAAGRLLAVRCSSGHLGPAGQRLCRVCAQPVPEQEPFEVVKPQLGRLCMPELPDLIVTGPVVLGRSPAADAVAGEARLVQVRNPEKDLSRSHVAVQVDGWQVSVVDLGTENGTVVQFPTGERRSLEPYAPVTISPSTTVVMSDRVSFWYEVP